MHRNINVYITFYRDPYFTYFISVWIVLNTIYTAMLLGSAVLVRPKNVTVLPGATEARHHLEANIYGRNN